MIHFILDWAWLICLILAFEIPASFMAKFINSRSLLDIPMKVLPNGEIQRLSESEIQRHRMWTGIVAVAKLVVYAVLLFFVSWKVFLFVWLGRYPLVLVNGTLIAIMGRHDRGSTAALVYGPALMVCMFVAAVIAKFSTG